MKIKRREFIKMMLGGLAAYTLASFFDTLPQVKGIPVKNGEKRWRGKEIKLYSVMKDVKMVDNGCDGKKDIVLKVESPENGEKEIIIKNKLADNYEETRFLYPLYDFLSTLLKEGHRPHIGLFQPEYIEIEFKDSYGLFGGEKKKVGVIYLGKEIEGEVDIKKFFMLLSLEDNSYVPMSRDDRLITKLSGVAEDVSAGSPEKEHIGDPLYRWSYDKRADPLGIEMPRYVVVITRDEAEAINVAEQVYLERYRSYVDMKDNMQNGFSKILLTFLAITAPIVGYIIHKSEKESKVRG